MLAAGYADSAHAQDLSQEWMFPGSIPRNSPLGSSEHVYLEGTSAANKASAEGASGARSGAGAFDANGEQKKEKKPLDLGNKFTVRKQLERGQLHVSFGSLETKPSKFPVVIKPVRGTGSAGVRVCLDEKSWQMETMDGHQPQLTMWEEMLPGTEYAVDITLDITAQNKRRVHINAIFLRVFRNTTDVADSLYILDTEDDTRKALHPWCERLAEDLELPLGKHHVEWRMFEDYVKLVEVNPGRHGKLTQKLAQLAESAYSRDEIWGFYVLRPGDSPPCVDTIVESGKLDESHYDSYGVFRTQRQRSDCTFRQLLPKAEGTTAAAAPTPVDVSDAAAATTTVAAVDPLHHHGPGIGGSFMAHALAPRA